MELQQQSQPRQPDIAGLGQSSAPTGTEALRRKGAPSIEFLRKAWVSVEARRLHEERIGRVAKAWAFAEWRSADSVRPCALISVLSSEYSNWTARIEAARLAMKPLRVVNVTPRGSAEEIFAAEVVVGSRRSVRAFRSAWISGDNGTMGGLLGYPACCCASFRSIFGSGQITDPSWSVGCATSGAHVAEGRLSVSGPCETNFLLRRIGVRGIPHFPCSFACEASRRLSRQMTELAASQGYAAEIGWLYEMLDWPLRWSALHGIAEIRAPVLKIATHTDRSAAARTLDWLGRTMPDEAAHGLDFPYREPTR